MKQVLLVALATLPLVALASSCALGSSGEPSHDGLLTRSHEGEESEMTALVGGILELDPDRGCVLLSEKPVVWPVGTTVTSDPPELRLPDGLTARSGDTITGGGGEVPAATIGETAIRVEGDLTNALACAPADSKVLVPWACDDGIGVASANQTRPCRVSQLRLRVSLKSATNALRGRVVAVNTIPFACSLSGRPRITLDLAGQAIRVTQGLAAPQWRHEWSKRPKGWPRVRIAPLKHYS